MDKSIFLTILSGLVLPALQALFTALLLGGIAGALAFLLGVPRWWAWAVLVGLLAAGIAWIAYTARWQAAVFAPPVIRAAAHQVIDHRPAKALTERTLRLTVVSDEGRRGDILQLPVSDSQMQLLARGLDAGQPFSLGTWTGQGKPFSRAEFEGLRSVLVTRGILRLRNGRAPAQGYELSPMGRAMMRRYADVTPPPAHGDQEGA